MLKKNDLLREKQLIKERLVEEEKKVFENFCLHYTEENDLRTLFIRYRHYLNDIYDTHWGTTIYGPLKRPIRIGYMMNTDIVFYSELDDVICNYLRNEGAEVIQFKCEDLKLEASKNGLQIYLKNEPVEFDGFLSYGYRSELNMQAYLTVVKFMEQKGIVCLHSHYHELILNDKALQAIHFAAAKVPIPESYQVFSIQSARDIPLNSAIIKNLHDYGADSVFKVEDKWNITNTVSKHLWKGEHVLVQKMVPDSIGESIRVLCIDGKAFAIIKYQDKSGDFRSNFSMGEKFQIISLMDDKKFQEYKEVAENAVQSIGNLLIGGVDLLDSKSEGIVVLEINSWPEVYDVWYHTKMCTFKRLSEAFLKKIKRDIDKENIEIVFLE